VTITIVIPFVNLTGGISVLLNYANWLHAEGHHVNVVYPTWPYRFHFGIPSQWREFRRQRRTAPKIPWFDLRCRLIRAPVIATPFLPAADIVVATSWPTVFDVARLARSRGRKVQMLFHHESGTGDEARIVASYARPFFRIACSRSVETLMADRFRCSIQEVVPCGFDETVFFPDGHKECDSVLMLYHDDVRKGASDGLAALEAFHRRQPHVRVRVCGTVHPPTLPSWISYEFQPSDADLRRLYSSSSAFLYPSRNEGFGLPLLEAMACGCAVVTTAVGAIPEFAIDGRNAVVVAPGAPSDMCRALERVLLDASLRARLSDAGKKTAERYTVQRTAPLFRDALARALTRA